MKIFGLAACLCLAVSVMVCAQTTPPDAPEPQRTENHSRFFSFTPTLGTASNARRMSTGDKFMLFAYNTANPFEIVATAAWAGISQAADTYPSWGQGAAGYGKRFGAAYADTAASNFFGYFLFPSILHQDPRYFRKAKGTFGSRFEYAVSRIFVTRTDSGGRAPNASLWLGAGASGAIANIYYPTDQQGVGLTAERAGISLATTAGFNVAREFWPDIGRRIFRARKK